MVEIPLKASLPSWLSGLLVVCVFPLFFIGGPDWFSPTVFKNIWDFGHIIFFAVLMLLLQTVKGFDSWRDWLGATASVLALGIGIEFIQHFVGRDANWLDVFHNLCGMWFGLFWGLRPTRIIWLLRGLSALLLLPPLWLVIDSGVADVQMRYQFPQINSFESRHEFQQIRFNAAQVNAQASNANATQGSSSLKITFGTQRYSGVRLVGPYGDWGKYSALAMDFYNPAADTIELAIKITDYSHDRGTNKFNDRFNRRVQLLPGWNSVTLSIDDIHKAPYQRDMQMDEISGLGIFTVDSPVERIVYWDNIRLQ
jgi:VanZ family protein